jgi:hypothetical protein
MLKSHAILACAILLVVGSAERVEASPHRFLSLPAFESLMAPDPVLIDWRILGGLDLVTGKAPASLQELDGKVVQIAAFIVPLEDDMQESDEFLLVPYFGACVHTPPPPPNQMVYVKMRGNKTVKIGWWDPVIFEGVLHFKQVESVYGASYFEMEGIASKPYKPTAK